jgi:asparagine synthase (glutamine-hydrolysing)
MCGLAGVLSRTTFDAEGMASRVGAMADSLRHRGPDARGIWIDPLAGVALGFRRLAILDLSEAGDQPMQSTSGRFVMVFNGEVYNYVALRQELTACGAMFKGGSDTEVILAAFERWGIENAVRRFVGMFAIAVWDRKLERLSLVRDRIGIKPLFYSRQPQGIYFASELKAFRLVPEFDVQIDPDALGEYLKYLYITAPRTIYRNTYKLPPGTILTLDRSGDKDAAPISYWSLIDVAQRGLAEPARGPEAEQVDEFEELLRDSVRLRMQADVPFGALLSGGIDSATTVAVMQSLTTHRVKTFTIGFDGGAFDESRHAKRVADHLGTDHTELHVTGREAMEVVPLLPEMFDEPHGDPSQIPTFLVCRLARTRVTVALTGDGGDELLAGYNRYILGERLVSRMGAVPQPVRRLAAVGIRSISTQHWDSLQAAATPIFQGALRTRLTGEKLRKLARILGQETEAERYAGLLSVWDEAPHLLGREAVRDPVSSYWSVAGNAPALERMMLVDQLTYLPDDLLAKVDRASMAVSLEARVPLLDHRLVEYSWRLPREMKTRNRSGKWILRRVLHSLVPAELVERPKMGFSPPVAEWLRGPLRSWAEDLLDPVGMARDGYLHPQRTQRLWRRFLAGHADLALGLWAVLQFQAWLIASRTPAISTSRN